MNAKPQIRNSPLRVAPLDDFLVPDQRQESRSLFGEKLLNNLLVEDVSGLHFGLQEGCEFWVQSGNINRTDSKLLSLIPFLWISGE
jgi:hypothetical protein